MYHTFYDLQHDPFSSTPDSALFFASASHQAALQGIIDGIAQGQSCVTLLGKSGLGKTLLLRAYLERIDPQRLTAVSVVYANLAFDDILKMLCQALGISGVSNDTAATMQVLHQALRTQDGHGRRVILLIDEAHHLPRQTLERVLQLLNFYTPTGESLIQIVFAGLPEFWQALHALRAQHRRFAPGLMMTLSRLTYKESMEYMQYRLHAMSSSAERVFSAATAKKITALARGNPGLLNTLCTNVLIAGALHQQKPVSLTLAHEVLATYEPKRAPWQRGAVYAASSLLVAGLFGGAQYGYVRVLPREMFRPAQLTQSFPETLTAAPTPQSVDVPERSNEPPSSAPLTQLAAVAKPSVGSLPPTHQADPTMVVAASVSPALEEPKALLTSPLLAAVPAVPVPPADADMAAVVAAHDPAAMPDQTILTASPLSAPVPAIRIARANEPVRKSLRVQSLPKLESRPLINDLQQGMARHVLPPAEPSIPLVPPNQVAMAPEPVVSPEPGPAQKVLEQPVPTSGRATKRQEPRRTVVAATAAPVVKQTPERGRLEDNHGVEQPEKSLEAHRAAPMSESGAAPAHPHQVALSAPVASAETPLFVGTPRLVSESGGHEAMIRELLFTADGRELVSVGDDKTIRIWSVAVDGRQATPVRTLRGQIGDGREGMMAAATLSPPDASGRQKWLAVGGQLAGASPDSYAVRLHDYATGEVVSLLRGHNDAILALAFSPTGRWLASAGKDATIRLWDLTALSAGTSAIAPIVLTMHTDYVYDLAWSLAGDRLASASYDKTVGFWNTSQLAQSAVTPLARLSGHDSQVQTVAFHPDGKVLVSGGKDQTIRLWGGQDGADMGVLARLKYKVAALAFAPDGGSLLAGNFAGPTPGQLTLLTYSSGKVQQEFTRHQNAVIATAFHPSGQWIATGGGEQKEILFWQAQSGEVLTRLEGKGRTVYAVGFSQDGRFLHWGTTAGDEKTSNALGPIEHRFDLRQLVRVAGDAADAKVRTQERVGAVRLSTERGGPYNYVTRLHIQQGGQRLGQVERDNLSGYHHSAYTLTPDGQHVVSGGMNGILQVYALDGTLQATCIGHTGEIKAVAVSSNGHWLVSGSNDQTVRLWSLTGVSTSGSVALTPALSLFPATDGEWVVWTPEGDFAASTNGARLLGYSMNQGVDKLAKFIPATQLYERLHRPDAIHTKLHRTLQQQAARQ